MKRYQCEQATIERPGKPIYTGGSCPCFHVARCVLCHLLHSSLELRDNEVEQGGNQQTHFHRDEWRPRACHGGYCSLIFFLDGRYDGGGGWKTPLARGPQWESLAETTKQEQNEVRRNSRFLARTDNDCKRSQCVSQGDTAWWYDGGGESCQKGWQLESHMLPPSVHTT